MGLSQLAVTPYDFTVFWGIDMLISGVDNSGGGPNVFLTDTLVNFLELNVQIGSPLRNITLGVTEGRVTAVAQSVLQTSGLTWTGGQEYAIAPMNRAEYNVVQLSLQKAIGTVAMALTAVGAQNDTYSPYGVDYLKNLTMLLAVVVHNAPCKGANLEVAQRESYMKWIQDELANLRSGRVEVVDGFTGAEFPALGWAEQGVTEWNAGRIALNRLLRQEG